MIDGLRVGEFDEFAEVHHRDRTLGPIPIDDIVGRAFVVFWPKAHWQWL